MISKGKDRVSPQPEKSTVTNSPNPPASCLGAVLFEGIVVEALNVKTALFVLAFLPQFLSPSELLLPQLGAARRHLRCAQRAHRSRCCGASSSLTFQL
jgi:threonine/homoserine/homoserine lactone efflux protein